MATARDRWARFATLAKRAPAQTFAIVDARVAAAHPQIARALWGFAGHALVHAGEGAKTFREVERLLRAAADLPRSATFLAIGGGTVGDLVAVVAHLHKRGAGLIHVPTTVLAAVDSSLGGKGAVNLGHLKNAAGVFHLPTQVWICTELFETLSASVRAEGEVEAWKMAASLDAETWRRWAARRPSLPALIRASRRMKQAVCDRDPLETRGLRQVLNFGHTFAHVLEGLSGFRLSHGAAVRLGVLCALDVGRALRVTPGATAAEVARGFEGLGREGLRTGLARQLGRAKIPEVAALLRGDKKSSDGELRMVLLTRLGRAVLRRVEPATWQRLLPAWQAGVTP